MFISTVLGDIPASNVGRTLTHEHLSLDFDKFYFDAPEHLRHYIVNDQRISLKNLGILRQYPYGSRYNLKFYDNESHDEVIEDVKLYKKWCNGNCTIVENTSQGILRDLLFYRKVAEETGVNIVSGTGHYVEVTQKTKDLAMKFEEMVELYTNEIRVGVDVSISGDGSDLIKCGFIGEVGSNWPLTGKIKLPNNKQYTFVEEPIEIFQILKGVPFKLLLKLNKFLDVVFHFIQVFTQK